MKQDQTLTVKIDPYNLITLFGVSFLFYGIWTIRDFLLLFMVSLTISIFVNGIIKKLAHYRIPRVLGALIFYLLLFALFFGVLILFIPAFIKELANFIQHYPQFASYFDFNFLLQKAQLFREQGSILAEIKNLSFSDFFSVFSSFFGGLVNFVIIFVISFYLSIQDHAIEKVLKIFLPKAYELSSIRVWKKTQEKIEGWFRGQVIIAMLLFIITAIGLSLMGIPYAILLSLLAALFGLVPYGIFIAILPTLMLAYSYGGFRMFITVIIFYTLTQQFLDYLIQPFVFKKTAGIPSILVVLAVIIGAKLFGFLGLIIAIPLTLFILELIREIEFHREHHHV